MQSLGEILRGMEGRRVVGVVEESPPLATCLRCNGHGFLSRGYDKSFKVWKYLEAPCVCQLPASPTFEQFDTFGPYPDLATALTATRSWVAGIGQGMLVLNGIPGTGKTHLTRAALRELIRVGADVLWLPDGQMIDAIMGSFQYHNTAALMATYGHQSWLLIDDFGLSNRPLATLPFIDRIMDARWVGSEHGLRTLLTTNLNPGDMTDRTASRLEDTRRVRAITIDAPDYRRNHGNS